MKFRFTLTGQTPLLLHADDVEKADQLQEWRKDSENRDITVKGDDRSPPWTWHTYCYHDGEYLTVPSDNLMVSLRAGAAEIILKGQKTFKSLSQSGLLLHDLQMPILVKGKSIPVSKINDLRDMPFGEQSDAVRELGFRLFVKRAKVGQSKHVRVRPRFDEWSLKGTVEIVAGEITESILKQMFERAGFYKGLCDWRPASPKSPGQFGRYVAKLEKVK